MSKTNPSSRRSSGNPAAASPDSSAHAKSDPTADPIPDPASDPISDLTGELTGAQDYSQAVSTMTLGVGYAASPAGAVYSASASHLGMFGSAYSSAHAHLGLGGCLLPTAALLGTGALEGTNRYSGPLLAGCAPHGLLPGYARPWAGTYATYRIMSAHPTLVLAGAAVMGPVMASSWSFEQNPKTAPSEAKAFIADLLEPLRPRLLMECLKALVFGWRGFEKVFTLKNGYLTLEKLKPLLPELTRILINDKGHLAGLSQPGIAGAGAAGITNGASISARAGARNGTSTGRIPTPAADGIQIPASKIFLYTYDRDGDNHYGRSRHENCRRQWSNWLMDEDNLGRLGSKVSSIIPQIGYPPGDGIDSQGNPQTNYQLALQLASGLASGRPITMPNLASLTIDDLTRLPELAQGSLWSIKTIDMGNPGPAQQALLKQLQYRDALLVRGWLHPERSLLESQRSGSRADSQVHTDLALTDCELVHADIVQAINEQIIDPLLAYNFGPSARGSVYIKPAPMSDDQQLLDQAMLQAIAANPQLLPELIAHLDMDAWLDRTGLPRSQLSGQWDGKMQAGTPASPAGMVGGQQPIGSHQSSALPDRSRAEIELFNPFHDARGRFTTGPGAASLAPIRDAFKRGVASPASLSPNRPASTLLPVGARASSESPFDGGQSADAAPASQPNNDATDATPGDDQQPDPATQYINEFKEQWSEWPHSTPTSWKEFQDEYADLRQNGYDAQKAMTLAFDHMANERAWTPDLDRQDAADTHPATWEWPHAAAKAVATGIKDLWTWATDAWETAKHLPEGYKETLVDGEQASTIAGTVDGAINAITGAHGEHFGPEFGQDAAYQQGRTIGSLTGFVMNAVITVSGIGGTVKAIQTVKTAGGLLQIAKVALANGQTAPAIIQDGKAVVATAGALVHLGLSAKTAESLIHQMSDGVDAGSDKGSGPRPAKEADITHPTGERGDQPSGPRTVNKQNASPDNKRGIARENEAADIMARAGYRVEQNPKVTTGKKPDYRIEGRIFDGYAPTSSGLRGVVNGINDKVTENQADRLVVYLVDSNVNLHDLPQAIHDYGTASLREVIGIKRDGTIIRLFP